MADDHEMRAECAGEFGKIRADLDHLSKDIKERREDHKELRELVVGNKDAVLSAFTLVRDDISGLKARAKGWSALIAALISIGIAVAVRAFSG